MGKNSRQVAMTEKEERRLVYYIENAEQIWVTDLIERFHRDRLTLLAVAEKHGVMDQLAAKLEASRKQRRQ